MIFSNFYFLSLKSQASSTNKSISSAKNQNWNYGKKKKIKNNHHYKTNRSSASFRI